jgi:uroporphyrinogen decarboxylase
MTGKERMLTALECKKPDRVPVFELAYNEPSIIGIASHFTDKLPPVKPAAEMEPEELLLTFEALALFIDELEIEGVTTRVLEQQEPLGNGYFKNSWGVVLKQNPFGLAFPMEGPIKERADLTLYSPPKVDADIDLMMLGMAKGRLGANHAVVFAAHDCFGPSWRLRGGLEHLLVDYMDNPQLAHDLARMTIEHSKELVSAAIDAGADAIVLEDDLAFNTNTLMSPAQFDEFISPYQKEIVDLIHEKGAKAIKHTDGNIWPILDRLIANGFDGIHPLQPQAGMDLKKVKAHCSGRICMLGNIDCIDLLPSGTEEEVEEAVKKAIDDAGAGGGYIISSSNTIHPGCKPENYIAMVHAARKYGVYS